MLYIVPTPIGNLQDITLRALETLKSVDAIICEDTRRTGILLSHFQITSKPLIILNDFNELGQLSIIINRLIAGENLALVSDAGTPLISDPGYKLVRECLKNNIPVDALPGPSSILPALNLSGLPPDKFTFLGFLPEKDAQQLKLFEKLKELDKIISVTYIAFVSPHKLVRNLISLQQILGDINVCLCRELTKIHQQVLNLPVSHLIEKYQSSPPKGEMTLVFNLRSD